MIVLMQVEDMDIRSVFVASSRTELEKMLVASWVEDIEKSSIQEDRDLYQEFIDDMSRMLNILATKTQDLTRPGVYRFYSDLLWEPWIMCIGEAPYVHHQGEWWGMNAVEQQ